MYNPGGFASPLTLRAFIRSRLRQPSSSSGSSSNTGSGDLNNPAPGAADAISKSSNSNSNSNSGSGSGAGAASDFVLEPVDASALRADICFALIDNEAQLRAMLAAVMPVLTQRGMQYSTSYDAEWHQQSGRTFLDPSTVISLVQIGIAEMPLSRDSAVLVLLFDVLQLSQRRETHDLLCAALQQILYACANEMTFTLAFDCRRDAKVLERFGVQLARLHNNLDLQLLERATRIEVVPSQWQNNWVFRLNGLRRTMTNFQSEESSLTTFIKYKEGVDADDSAATFLARPLARSTLLYTSVDVAALFFLYVEFTHAYGDLLRTYLPEVLDATRRYANFDMRCPRPEFSEHGLLPLKVLPRLDGGRAGDHPCSVCLRPVARAPGGMCIVCRKRLQDLQRQQNPKPQTPPQQQQGAAPAAPAAAAAGGIVVFPAGSPIYSGTPATPAQQQQQQYVRLSPGPSVPAVPHYPSFAAALAAQQGQGQQQMMMQPQQPGPSFMTQQQARTFNAGIPPHVLFQQQQYLQQQQQQQQRYQ